jgi:chromosome partitioning protein
MNLGYQLGQRKEQKVLLIDMDPQASLTIFMGLDPTEQELTVRDAILDKKNLPIYSGTWNGSGPVGSAFL